MKSIQVLCAAMALWKLLEIVISPYIWRVAVQNWENRPRTKIRLVTIASLIYVVCTIILMFTHLFWVALALWVIGVISTLSLFPYVKRSDKFNIHIFCIMCVDSIISIFLLLSAIW